MAVTVLTVFVMMVFMVMIVMMVMMFMAMAFLAVLMMVMLMLMVVIVTAGTFMLVHIEVHAGILHRMHHRMLQVTFLHIGDGGHEVEIRLL